MNQKPRGGTELQLEYLYRHVDNKLLDGVQITTSVPEKIPLSKDKPNILWQKNSWDQPNLQEFFGNKERHKEYDWYVFNSHWNYEKFRYFFDVPTDRSIVIKNKRTGKVYADIDEFKADVLDPNTDTTTEDFRQDLEIKVTKVSMGALTKK